MTRVLCLPDDRRGGKIFRPTEMDMLEHAVEDGIDVATVIDVRTGRDHRDVGILLVDQVGVVVVTFESENDLI